MRRKRNIAIDITLAEGRDLRTKINACFADQICHITAFISWIFTGIAHNDPWHLTPNKLISTQGLKEPAVSKIPIAFPGTWVARDPLVDEKRLGTKDPGQQVKEPAKKGQPGKTGSRSIGDATIPPIASAKVGQSKEKGRAQARLLATTGCDGRPGNRYPLAE